MIGDLIISQYGSSQEPSFTRPLTQVDDIGSQLRRSQNMRTFHRDIPVCRQEIEGWNVCTDRWMMCKGLHFQ